MKMLFLLGMVLALSSNVNAAENNANPDPNTKTTKWVGEVSDSASTHTTQHGHSLVFKDRETGKTYDVVDSPELVKVHHENEKNYEVEIEAEKTPQFLFWGGNLIVRNFKILNETSSVPHLAPPREPSFRREFGGGRGRM